MLDTKTKGTIQSGLLMGLHRMLISQTTQYFKPEEGPESQYFSDLCFYIAKDFVAHSAMTEERECQALLERNEI